MKPAAFLAALVLCLACGQAAHAGIAPSPDQAVAVSDRRIQECEDIADAKKLKGLEREKFIKQCGKGSE